MRVRDFFRRIFSAIRRGVERPFYGSPFYHAAGVPRKIDPGLLIRNYRSWVYIAGHRNAVAVASSTLRLYITRTTSGRFTRAVPTERRRYLERQADLAPYLKQATGIEEVIEHPFLDLMKNVNRRINQFDMWEVTEGFLETTGNAFWYIVDDGMQIPQMIELLSPAYMKVLLDESGKVRGYLWEKDTQKILLEAEDVIHFMIPSLENPFWGMAPMEAVATAVNINKNMGLYEESIFRNMGRLEGFFTTAERINDTEFERLKNEIAESMKGVENAGRTPLLDQGLDYKQFGFTPRELGYLQGRRVTREEIINAYDQTAALYESSSNRATSETATVLWTKYGIRPRLTRLQQKLNEQLMPRYQDRLFVAFDDPVPEDKEFRLEEIKTRLGSWYSSVNQERALDGKEPVDWGNVPLAPINILPLGAAPATQQPQTEELADAILRRVKEKLNNG